MHQEYLDYYSSFDEEGRLTSQNITRVEFDTSIHKLAPYTKRCQTLTEFGAATGQYSLFYAQQGIDVTAVELVPELVSQLKSKAQTKELDIHIHQANATHVPFIDDASQDVVLILGPLYHIQQQGAREAVLKEAHRILRDGGIVAVAYISRFFVAGLLAKMTPSLVTPQILTQLSETGLITTPDVDAFFRTGYFATPSEIERLVESQRFNIQRHLASDSFVRYMGQEINTLSPSQYQAWLEYHLGVCEEPSLLGSSNHGLVIAQKY